MRKTLNVELELFSNIKKWKDLLRKYFISNLFIYNVKCFKKCGCSKNGQCNYCNSDYFIGYDLFNSNTNPRYTLINANQTAANTTGLTCTSSNVEVQVNEFKRVIQNF